MPGRRPSHLHLPIPPSVFMSQRLALSPQTGSSVTLPCSATSASPLLLGAPSSAPRRAPPPPLQKPRPQSTQDPERPLLRQTRSLAGIKGGLPGGRCIGTGKRFVSTPGGNPRHLKGQAPMRMQCPQLTRLPHAPLPAGGPRGACGKRLVSPGGHASGSDRWPGGLVWGVGRGRCSLVLSRAPHTSPRACDGAPGSLLEFNHP